MSNAEKGDFTLMTEGKEVEFAKRFVSGNQAADESFSEVMKKVDPVELAKLIDEAVGGGVEKLQTFVDLTRDIKAKNDELAIMASDTLPAAIITSYISDVLEPNNNGDLISIVANNPNSQAVLDTIYQQLSIPADKVIYNLLVYGIAIAKFDRAKVSRDGEKPANEDIKVAVNYGQLLPEVEIVQDVSTVFPILRNEKCIGYIEVTKSEVLEGFNWLTDNISYEDVVIHSPLDYAYVKFGVNKSTKPLQLRIRNKDGNITVYNIDTGCSLLENSYSAWKTLSVLQDSVVLASLIKNASTIIVQTEAGNMSDTEIEVAKVKLKSLFEGKLSLGRDGLKSYISPQAKPNYVYSFTSNGTGAITTETVGGEYNPGQLYYLDPFYNAFFGGMNYPKQQVGFGDSAGLDGGGAVEEYTKRYLSTVSQFKRLLSAFIRNCENNVLTSRSLPNLINDYDVVVYKAYKDEDQAVIQMQQMQLQVMNDLFTFIEIKDPIQIRNIKLAMVKKTFSDKALIDSIEEAMMKETPDEEEKTPEDISKEEEPTGDDIISDIEDETDEISEEIPPEETETTGGEMEELPPMLGTIPEE